MDPALLNMTSAPGVGSMAILKVSALRPSELLMLDTGKTSVAIVDILSIYLDLALLSRILALNVEGLATSDTCVMGLNKKKLEVLIC